MRFARRLWVRIAILVTAFAVGAVLVAGPLGYLRGGGTANPKGNYSVAEAKNFTDFPVFYAGESANGYPLTSVLRDSLRRGQVSMVFLYGDCEIPADQREGGCNLPVNISNEPACVTNLSLYGPYSPVNAHIRGAPAAFFENGSRLEIQTGTTMIVIFAFSKREVLSVARRLRGVNSAVSARDPLPPPALGALEGKLPCPRR